MNNDKGYFDSPEFRELLKRYEQARENNAGTYFGAEEFADLLSYYLFIEKPEKAGEALKLSQRIHPGAAENIRMEAKLLLYTGEPQKAFKKLSEFGFIDDDETLILQAEILLALKDFKNAREIALIILKKATPEQDSVYDALEVLLDCGAATEALQICEKALKMVPGKKNLLEVKAECLIELQQNDSAIEIYNRLLDEEPYSTFYWEQLGHIHYLTKRFGKAIECFEYESTINESIEYAQMMQAYCYHFVGDYKKAREIFAVFSENYPKSAVPPFYVALSHYREGDKEKALELFKELTNTLPEGGIEIMLARINKAIILSEQGKHERAEETISMALLMHPDNMKQLLIDDTALYELKDKENLTFDDMSILDAKEWSQAEELYRLGIHLFELGHGRIAERVLRYCLEFSHDKSDICAYLAHIQWHSGRRDDAIARIGDALEGKSWILFKLFNVPYRTNMEASAFAKAIEAAM